MAGGWSVGGSRATVSSPMAVIQVIDSRQRDLGGFVVRRVLPCGARQMVGPFIFFDHLGPTQFPPGEGIDVRPHPHIALATVTYLFSGSLLHRDSLGSVQEIRPGDVNWMSAGKCTTKPPRSRWRESITCITAIRVDTLALEPRTDQPPAKTRLPLLPI